MPVFSGHAGRVEVLPRTCPTRAEESEIQKHTWKWVAGCIILLGAIIWFVRAQLAARSFDWSLAVASFGSDMRGIANQRIAEILV